MRRLWAVLLIWTCVVPPQVMAAGRPKATPAHKGKAAAAEETPAEREKTADQIDDIVAHSNDLSPDDKKALQEAARAERCEAAVQRIDDVLKRVGIKDETRKGITDKRRNETNCGLKTPVKPTADVKSCKVDILPFKYDPPIGSDVSGFATTLRPGDDPIQNLTTKRQIGRGTRVVIGYFNLFRYNITPQEDITTIPNPTLPSSITGQAVAPSVVKTTGVEVTAMLPTKPDTPDNVLDCVDYLKSKTELLTQNIDDLAKAKKDIAEALKNSDQVVKDPSSLRGSVKTLETNLEGASQIGPLGDNAKRVLAKVAELEQAATDVKADPAYQSWFADSAKQKKYAEGAKTIGELKTTLATYLPGTQQAVQAATQQAEIVFWYNRAKSFSGLDPDEAGRVAGLTYLVEGSCTSLWGGAGESRKTKFTVQDLKDTTTKTTAEVIEVICPPLLSVTGGLGFSTLHQRTFEFRPSKKVDALGNVTVESQITATDDSSVRPAYGLLVNVRLHQFASVKRDWVNDWALHGSLGTVASSQGQTTNLEFLFGPSFSYKGTVYLTPGLHLGKVTELTGGFHVGDPQGTLQQPPTRSVWQPGFGFVVTFPVAPR